MKIQSICAYMPVRNLNSNVKNTKIQSNNNINYSDNKQYNLPGYNLFFGALIKPNMSKSRERNFMIYPSVSKKDKEDIEREISRPKDEGDIFNSMHELVYKYKDNINALKHIGNYIDYDAKNGAKYAEYYLSTLNQIFGKSVIHDYDKYGKPKEKSKLSKNKQKDVIKHALFEIKAADGKTIPQAYIHNLHIMRAADDLTRDIPRLAYEVLADTTEQGLGVTELILEKEATYPSGKKLKTLREDLNRMIHRLATQTREISVEGSIRLLEANMAILDKDNLEALEILRSGNFCE